MVEDAAQAVTDWLTGLDGEDLRHYTILILAALVSYRLLGLALRSLLPALLRVVLGVLQWIALGLSAAGLFAQAGVALLFRLVRLRPPGLLYRLGDALGRGASVVRRRTPVLQARTYALSNLPGMAVLIVAVFLGWQVHEFRCERAPTAEMCQRPADAVVGLADETWQSISSFLARDAS